MAMTQTKRVTVDVSSCVNCPHVRQFNSDNSLYCPIINEWIKPSAREFMVTYYHEIPDKCPFPTVEENNDTK